MVDMFALADINCEIESRNFCCSSLNDGHALIDGYQFLLQASFL